MPPNRNRDAVIITSAVRIANIVRPGIIVPISATKPATLTLRTSHSVPEIGGKLGQLAKSTPAVPKPRPTASARRLGPH